jgi:hypothetical protein
MLSARFSCQIVKKIEFCDQIFENYSNVIFHEHPFSRGRIVPRGRMDGLTDGQT